MNIEEWKTYLLNHKDFAERTVTKAKDGTYSISYYACGCHGFHAGSIEQAVDQIAVYDFVLDLMNKHIDPSI